MRSPEALADHRDARRAGAIFVGGERAADHRLQADRLEHLRRHEAADQPLGLIAAGQVEHRAAIDAEVLEDLVLLAPVLKIRPRDRHRLARRASSPPSIMMRSMSAYGYGRSITASTTLKIAVVAPMPSASVSMTTAVKPGALRSVRSAKRTSLVTASTGRDRIDASSSTSPASRRIASSWPMPPRAQRVVLVVEVLAHLFADPARPLRHGRLPRCG